MLLLRSFLLLLFSFFATKALFATTKSEEWLRLSRQAIVRQELDLALHHISVEIAANPRNARAYLERARVYQLQGALTKAAEDQRKAYQINPALVKNHFATPIHRLKNKLADSTLMFNY